MAVDQKRRSEDSDAALKELTSALRSVRLGDFAVRMPRSLGLAGEANDAFNDVLSLLEQRNRELMRISRVVGREGRLTERVDEEIYVGSWGHGVRAVNNLIDDLAQPTN